jgi:hypothetical protein
VFDGDEALIGDRDPVRVAGEIVQDLLRSRKGRLSVDVPRLGAQLRDELLPREGLGERGARPGADEHAATVRVDEAGEKLPAKERGHRGHGEEVAASLAAPPAGAVEPEAAVANGSTRANVRLWTLCRPARAKRPLESPINPLLGALALDRVVTSPLLRARETADAVAGALGLPLTVEPDLAELDFGSWEGRFYDQLIADREYLAFSADPLAASPPRGESVAAAQARAIAALGRALATTPGARICAVTLTFQLRGE